MKLNPKMDLNCLKFTQISICSECGGLSRLIVLIEPELSFEPIKTWPGASGPGLIVTEQIIIQRAHTACFQLFVAD